MTERYTIKSQGDYFGVVDNNIDDRVCVVNGIHTRIEAAWLMELLNRLNDENEQLKQSIKEIDDAELHLKQIILKRIDDYIWEWDDEGTPVAQVLKELKEDIMTEKRFNFIKDTVAENLKTPISDGNNILSIGEVLDELNKLNDENEQLQKSLSASVEKNRKLQRIFDKLGYEYIGDSK